MTREEIVKYTGQLLAEFYKNCPKQYNKEKRQADIILSNGDFSTLQNMICEAIINMQSQTVDRACEILKNTIDDDVLVKCGSVIKCIDANEFAEYFHETMIKE